MGRIVVDQSETQCAHAALEFAHLSAASPVLVHPCELFLGVHVVGAAKRSFFGCFDSSMQRTLAAS